MACVLLNLIFLNVSFYQSHNNPTETGSRNGILSVMIIASLISFLSYLLSSLNFILILIKERWLALIDGIITFIVILLLSIFKFDHLAMTLSNVPFIFMTFVYAFKYGEMASKKSIYIVVWISIFISQFYHISFIIFTLEDSENCMCCTFIMIGTFAMVLFPIKLGFVGIIYNAIFKTVTN